ncbi:MAG: tripartite tricarboxylate transporter substrate binding protein [Pseudomonadota bacterium]
MIKKMKLTGIAALCCVGLGLGAAHAQSNVTKVIIPFPAGGGTDNLGRIFGRFLQQDLGETVIVENRPGAGGNIAHDFVAASPADGKTILFTTNSLVIAPLVDRTVKFDPQKSFTPIIALAHSPVVVLAKRDAPFNDMAGMLSHAKANPGKLSFSTCGQGSIHHLSAEQLKASAGINMLHVPYKGCSPGILDLAGGQVDVGFISLTSAASYISSNKVKALAVTSAKPSGLLPGVPTVTSAGVKNYDFDGWYAIMAPPGTPAARINRLNASLNKALADDEVKKTLAAGFLEPLGGTPSYLAEMIARETAYYRKIVTDAKITAD